MNRIALLPALLTAILALVAAQPGGTSTNNNDQYPHARLSPSMATIIVVLIAVVFFMVFFSIYLRHCSDSSHGPIGSIRRAAACGLDPSVLETFPILTYSEVRDHKIGKDALECAVCLNEFEPDETLRLIPRCDHVFHPDCIDAWLESHVTCPVCRANLIPEPAASDNLPASMPPLPPPTDDCPEIVAVQVDDVSTQPGRSASLTRAKTAIVLGRFRSHSTGHSVEGMGVVRQGENLERFTLRLPEQVRKEVMDRSMLNRTGSCAAPGLQSHRGRLYKRVGQDSRSDRWLFFSRGLSIKSPKVMAEAGEDSGCGGRTPVNIASFKCLEPKAADETGLFSPEHDARSLV